MDATQAFVTKNQQEKSLSALHVGLSVEAVAYLALVMLALVLRIAQLDSVPLSPYEARQALAAWRAVSPEAAGTPIVAESPLLFALHSLAFTVLGGSELSVRLLTALASIGLILSPILFRGLLGRVRTLIFSILLTFSPILLVASRTDSPVIWALLAAVLGLWALRRSWEGGDSYFAIAATVCLVALVLLTGPTGLFLALVIGGAGLFAISVRRGTEDELESDEAGNPITEDQNGLKILFNDWPWAAALLAGSGFVFLVATQFMSYSPGLSAVGELLSAGLRGFVTPQPYSPGFFPILITLFYEPVLVILGIGTVAWLIREERFSGIERFFAAWVVLGLLFGLIYPGGRADQALWLVIPLIGLVSLLITDLLTKSTDSLWWSAPGWSKWLVAGAVVGLLGMLTIHAQTLARSLLFSPDNLLQLGSTSSVSVVWVIIIILFIVIGYFLASSLWGVGTTTQGGLIGLVIFTLITGLGGGWRVSVFGASDPLEFWNRNPTHGEVLQLRQTLVELADRQSGGFPQISITALVPEDGVIAWELRDFPNTRFINDVSAAGGQEIVILPASFDKPDLGGPYVGENITVSSGWDMGSLRAIDFPAWWLQRRTRTAGVPRDQVALWLRQDVYDGVPFEVKP